MVACPSDSGNRYTVGREHGIDNKRDEEREGKRHTLSEASDKKIKTRARHKTNKTNELTVKHNVFADDAVPSMRHSLFEAHIYVPVCARIDSKQLI